MQKVDPGTIAVQIVELVKQKLRTGELKPGDRLVETKLIQETGAKRTHVRDALQRLAGELLIDFRGFSGASVRHLEPDDLAQIAKVRESLESLGARLAAQADQSAKDRIAAIQAEMDAAETTGDSMAYASANFRWHEAISEAGGNSYVSNFLSTLWIPTFRLAFDRSYTADIMARSNSEHRLVTACIVRGHDEEAAIAMRLHISSGHAAQVEAAARPARKQRT